MFAEDLQQRDRSQDLSCKSQLADRIAVALNHIWIDGRRFDDEPTMAVPVGDRFPSLRGRNP